MGFYVENDEKLRIDFIVETMIIILLLRKTKLDALWQFLFLIWVFIFVHSDVKWLLQKL